MKLPLLLATLLAFAASLAGQTAPAKLSLGTRGIVIDAGPMGTFIIPAPELHVGPKPSKHKAEYSYAGGDTAEARYPGGATLRLQVDTAGTEILYTYAGLPEDARGFMHSMNIPIEFADGGHVQIGNDERKPLPAQATVQFVTVGVGGPFRLTSPSGATLAFTGPGNWCAVQDNRTWNDQKFVYQFFRDTKGWGNATSYTIRLDSPAR